MPYHLKETGESYEQFLKRNRAAESNAKDGLPENEGLRRIWEMEAELETLMNDNETVNLGWMNGWGPDEESYYKHLIDSGVKFKRIRHGSYWECYNVKEKIVFKIDSGD